jgi:hypothetical protein
MDELERFTQSSAEEKAKIWPWVAREVADLGLIAKLRNEVNTYQTWGSGFDHEMMTYDDGLSQLMSPLGKVLGNPNLEGKMYSDFGAPVEGRFNYPSDKRRTKQTTDKMRQAESNLHLFWSKVDSEYRKKSGKSLNQAHNVFSDGSRPMERTPELVEVRSPAPNSAPDLTQRTSHPMSITEESSDSKFVAPQLKVKPKTRGSTS